MNVLKVLLWPIAEPPWHALAAVWTLFGHYALVRLALWRKKAVFVDIWNAFTIALWIGFWQHQVQMREWEITVVAPIRIDLFPWTFVLYIVTIICLLSSWGSVLNKYEAGE